MRRVFLLQLAALGLAACASAVATPRRRYEGIWDWGFETSAFSPSDGQGRWWLSAEGEAWRALSAPLAQAGRGPWGRLHLVIEGELSAPGSYGHLGAYSHELRVTRVIEARPLSASESQPSDN